VGLLLDVALVVLAVLVVGTLGLLAWTLGVAGLDSVRQERERVSALRQGLTDAERRLPSRAAAIREVLRRLSARLKGDE
jgi:hypothetical protein